MPRKITIPKMELYDERKQEFVYVKETTLMLEHSLVSISKWESKWCKPFLTDSNKTAEELRDYVRCMTLTQNVDPEIYKYLTDRNMIDVHNYIDSKMSATTFHDSRQTGRSREQITSELIYYWMVAYEIPFECQKWHLNRLLNLIRICGIKGGDTKKMSKGEIYNQNRALNEARRRKYHTKG